MSDATKDTVVSVPIEEHIGEDKIDDIASKIKARKTPKKGSSKRKMSVNSLKNLAQYNDDVSKDSRKTMVKNLQFNIKKDIKKEIKPEPVVEEVALEQVKDIEVSISSRKYMLTDLIDEVFPLYTTFDSIEQVRFINNSANYLKDFGDEDLSFSDFDDVMSLALNKILEYRFLKDAKGNKKMATETLVSSLQKIKKQNEGLKESLSSRRKDRKKDTGKSGVTILDLAAAFDKKRLADRKKFEETMLDEENEFMESRKDHGNKDDIDAT